MGTACGTPLVLTGFGLKFNDYVGLSRSPAVQPERRILEVRQNHLWLPPTSRCFSKPTSNPLPHLGWPRGNFGPNPSKLNPNPPNLRPKMGAEATCSPLRHLLPPVSCCDASDRRRWQSNLSTRTFAFFAVGFLVLCFCFLDVCRCISSSDFEGRLRWKDSQNIPLDTLRLVGTPQRLSETSVPREERVRPGLEASIENFSKQDSLQTLARRRQTKSEA